MEKANKIKAYIGIVVTRLLALAGLLIAARFVLKNVFKIDIAASPFDQAVFNIAAAAILLVIYLAFTFFIRRHKAKTSGERG